MKLFTRLRKKTSPGEDATIAAPALEKISLDTGKGRKILLVDGDEVVLKVFEKKLNAYGFEVVTATEGVTAVGAARRHRPHLIVLDVKVTPQAGAGLQWEGFNITQWLRCFEELSSIPIIVTSGDPAALKYKALAHGVSAFFRKPVNYHEFLLAVHRAISQSNGCDKMVSAQQG